MLARSNLSLLIACLVAVSVQAFMWQQSLTRTEIIRISRGDGHGDEDAIGSLRSSHTLPSLLSLKVLKRDKQEQETQQEAAASVNNLVNLVASISLLASAGTLWSEATIYQTGCGPLYMPDLIERTCYQVVLAVSGVVWFIRIVFRQGLQDFFLSQQHKGISNWPGHDKNKCCTTSSRKLLNVVEGAAYLAVIGAFLVLLNQMENNVQMDGLSGIDIAGCKARRDFLFHQR